MLRNCGCLWSVVYHLLHLLTNERPVMWPGDQSEASSLQSSDSEIHWGGLRLGSRRTRNDDLLIAEWWQLIKTSPHPGLEAHGGFEAGRCRQDGGQGSDKWPVIAVVTRSIKTSFIPHQLWQKQVRVCETLFKSSWKKGKGFSNKLFSSFSFNLIWEIILTIENLMNW